MFIFFSLSVSAQEKDKVENNEFHFEDSGQILGTKILKKNINIKKGEIVTNVLQLFNNSASESIAFSLEILTPKGWIPIINPREIHRVTPKDTISVPIILIPAKEQNDISETNINLFVVNLNGSQLANDYFTVQTIRKNGWTIQTDKQIQYLKNGETNTDFKYNITNTGNHDQDIYIQYKTPQNNILIKDSLQEPVNASETITLKPQENISKEFLVEMIKKEERNKKQVSVNSYDPDKDEERINHDIIVQTKEPKYVNGNAVNRNSKISFVKVPNQIVADRYGYSTLPLIVDLNVQNVLSDRSYATLNLRGQKNLSPTSQIAYSTQLSYATNVLTNDVLKNAPWYVGYFDDKKSIEVGQISGNVFGLQSSGYGVRASYQLTSSHGVSAFYVRPGSFFDQKYRNESYGGEYKFNFRNFFSSKIGGGKNINEAFDRILNVAYFQPKFNLFKKHRFSFLGAYSSQSNQSDPTKDKTGYVYGGSYSSNLFNKKWKPFVSYRTNTKGYGNSNYVRTLINHRSTFTLNKRWDFISTNSLQEYENYSTVTDTLLTFQKVVTNNLSLARHYRNNNIQFGGYYHYYNTYNTPRYERGGSIRHSISNFSHNFLSSTHVRVGYNKAADPLAPNYFNLELSSFLRYRTWSFTNRYFYGTTSLSTALNPNLFITPQTFRSSVQNQYMFKNKRLVMENSLIYNYTNINQKNGVGFYNNIYFFAKHGFRYNLQANLNYSSNTYQLSSLTSQNLSTPILEDRNLSQLTFNISFGLRKELGIPVPFLKNKKTDLNFIAFLDIDGNGVKNNGEVPINNVVIKVGEHEVITDLNGEASVKKIFKGAYKVDILPLEDVNGWFPNINTESPVEFKEKTIYVPFSRGVKLVGDVILDRQEIANAENKKTDLSRIKITASGKTTEGKDKTFETLTDKDGHFEFYLANGSYTLTIDESILDSNLRLMRNNIPITLKNSQNSVYTAFYIKEKRREVKIIDFTNRN